MKFLRSSISVLLAGALLLSSAPVPGVYAQTVNRGGPAFPSGPGAIPGAVPVAPRIGLAGYLHSMVNRPELSLEGAELLTFPEETLAKIEALLAHPDIEAASIEEPGAETKAEAVNPRGKEANMTRASRMAIQGFVLITIVVFIVIGLGLAAAS